MHKYKFKPLELALTAQRNLAIGTCRKSFYFKLIIVQGPPDGEYNYSVLKYQEISFSKNILRAPIPAYNGSGESMSGFGPG